MHYKSYRPHTHRHTRPTDSFMWTTKMDGKISIETEREVVMRINGTSGSDLDNDGTMI